MEPTFFTTPAAFRAWLAAHHETESELLVGFHKRATGRPSMTWPESVDEALCFGWIDGVRRSLGEESYTIRFTPRKARSTWSAINVTRFGELRESGLVAAAGLAAFERRSEDRTAVYSYEQRREAQLGSAFEARFRASPEAWAWFQAQAPSYRRVATYWVVSAKRADTRERRLAQLIEDSAAGQRIRSQRRP
jgi:uncharacterized protein YdeI (YjbR/CyaY-like superfamily)